jgi:hypothetical protein
MVKDLLISLVVYSLIAIWYVVPWLNKLDKRQALTAPLWVHVFRYLALYLLVAQREGYAISDQTLNVVVIGDLSGAVLALAGIIFLRMRSRLGPIFAALVLIASITDIAVGTYVRSLHGSDPEATGVWWLVFVFFAPAVLVSLPLLGWQLYQRRGEALSSPT